MPCFLHYITVLIENSTLLSEYGRFLTAIFYSAGIDTDFWIHFLF